MRKAMIAVFMGLCLASGSCVAGLHDLLSIAAEIYVSAPRGIPTNAQERLAFAVEMGLAEGETSSLGYNNNEQPCKLVVQNRMVIACE